MRMLSPRRARRLALAPAFLLLAPLAGPAQNNPRLWTVNTGPIPEATVNQLRPPNLALVTRDRRQNMVKMSELSLGDRQYLVDQAKVDPKFLTEGPLCIPEKQLRFDRRGVEKPKEKFIFDPALTSATFDRLHTKHFIVAYSGKAEAEELGELAERLWHGMSFQHPNFASRWGTNRLVVVLCGDAATHEALGEWYLMKEKEANADHQGQMNAAQQFAAWKASGGIHMELKDEVRDREKAFPVARVFNLSGDYQKSGKQFNPFLINALSSDLLSAHLGQTGGGPGFALMSSHAYYKEIHLSGETQTRLIKPGQYGGDDMSTKAGFDDGTGWAKLLKNEVKRGRVKPDLADVLSTSYEGLTPEKLVLMFALGSFMQNAPDKIVAYAKVIRGLEDGGRADPATLATALGFESVEKFDAAWKEYILGSAFK